MFVSPCSTTVGRGTDRAGDTRPIPSDARAAARGDAPAAVLVLVLPPVPCLSSPTPTRPRRAGVGRRPPTPRFPFRPCPAAPNYAPPATTHANATGPTAPCRAVTPRYSSRPLANPTPEPRALPRRPLPSPPPVSLPRPGLIPSPHPLPPPRSPSPSPSRLFHHRSHRRSFHFFRASSSLIPAAGYGGEVRPGLVSLTFLPTTVVRAKIRRLVRPRGIPAA